MKPEIKTQFEKACETLGLDDQRRDKAWTQIRDLGLNPDDPTVIFLAVAGTLDRAVTDLPKAINDMPARITAAANEAVGKVAKAASLQVAAKHAELSVSTGQAVAESAGAYFNDMISHRRLKVSAVVASCALAVALLFGLVGFWLGSWNLSALDTAFRQLAARGDIKTILQVVAANPDLNRTIANSCGSGTGNVVIAEGLRNCRLPLWLDIGGMVSPAPAAPGSVTVSTIWSAGLGFLNGYRPVTILLIGMVAGLLLRKLLLLKKIPGVGWLVS